MADQTFAVHCGFFDAIDSDRTYSADEMNRPYRRVISNGVFATPQGNPSTDLQVVESTGMDIICKAGEGLFGDKWFENPSSIVITVPNNTATVPRIDSVLVQVDTRTSGRVGNIVHRTGTPSSSPTPPAINQTEGVVEYRLANIRVNAGVTSIQGRYITDRRGSSDCPWVTSLIYQVDTSTLYDQWQAAYEEYFEAEKAIWDAWYAQLTEDLDVSMTLDRHTNTVTTTATTTGTIPIGLAYNHNTDILEVYINGLRAVEGTHYIVVNDDTSIMVENQLDIGQTVTFVVMRSVISGSATTIMVLLQELESQIAGIAGGTPSVVDSTDDMTDTGKIYILSSDSKWYYYSAAQSDWVPGGTYGGVPTDTTLTLEGMAADAKATGDALDALDDRVTALEGGTGLTADIKAALLACFANVAWAGNDGQDFYDALDAALNPAVNLSSITAVYTQSGTVYDTASLDDLKADLVVTAHWSDTTTSTITTYTLSGTLTAGTSTITVSYSGKTTTFTVTVSETVPSTYTKHGYIKLLSTNDKGLTNVPKARWLELRKYDNLNAISCEIEAQSDSLYTGTRPAMIGRRSASGYASSFAFYAASNSSILGGHLHGTEISQGPSFLQDVRNIIKYTNTSASPSSLKVNDGEAVSVVWANNDTLNLAPVLFGNPTNDSNSDLSGSHRIGYIKIFDLSGDMIGYYIPVVRVADNVIGMYEVINQTFYTAATSSYATVGDSNCIYQVGEWS